jgi:uncharacterized protein (TIRG00374 family)
MPEQGYLSCALSPLLSTASSAGGDRVNKNGRAVWIAVLVGVPVSALFLWLAVRNADLAQVWDVVTAADRWTLALAVVVVGLVYILQGLRWRVIVGGHRPSRTRYAELVVGGIACNNVLPGRLGELFRAREIAVEARLPSGRGLATVVLDRCFDIVALVLFLCISLPTVISEAWLVRIAGGAAVLIGAIAFGLLFARHYTRMRARERRSRGLLRGVVRDTLEGLASPLGRRRIIRATGLSVVAWCAWAAAAILVARSVGVDLSALDALFVSAVINLGVAIPSSPGFVGTFQWLGVQSLAVLGVAHEEALAFSILMHAVWYVPTTIVGSYILIARTDWRAFRRRGGPSVSVIAAPPTSQQQS